MKRIFYLLAAVIFTLFINKAFAQLERPHIPPSPNAAAITGLANVDVSHYTGVANVSIPLHTISARDLSIPVSLDYQTTGIKVQQVATSVGLGWNLNAASFAITRVVRGLPDGQVGFCPTDANAKIERTSIFATYNETCDAERDIFYFSFPGRAGKVFLGSDETPQTMPFQNLAISPGVGSASVGYWKIVDESGYEYYFGESASSQEQTTYYIGDHTTNSFVQKHTYISTWYLTRIVAPTGIQVATFTYSPGPDVTYYNYGVRVADCLSSNIPFERIDVKIKIISPKYISIISGTGVSSCVFSYDTDRSDLPGAWRLATIAFKDNNNIDRRKFWLDGGCFNTYPGFDCKRLKLSAIREGLLNPITTHTFKYNETEMLPKEESYYIDHYGYYNYKAAIDAVDPGVERLGEASRSVASVDGICNNGRSKNSNGYSLLLILQEVQYSTGARTIFGYSQTDFPARLTTLSQYDVNTLISRSTFTYAGKQVYKTPVYHYYDIQASPNLLIRSSNSFNSIYDIDGVAFGFSTVTETLLDGSKIIRTFNNFSDFPDDPPLVNKYKVVFPGFTYLGSANVDSSPFTPYSSKSSIRGTLKSVEVRDNQDNPVQRHEYNYQLGNTLHTVWNMAVEPYHTVPGDYHFYVGDYTLRSQPVYLSYENSYVYDQTDPTKSTVKTTLYSYHSTYKTLPTSVVSKLGTNSSEQKVVFKYPIDVAGTGTQPSSPSQRAEGIWSLISNHVIVPVEKIVYNKEYGSPSFRVVGAELNVFRKNPSLNKPVLMEMYRLDLSTPTIALSPEATLTSGGTVFSFDSHYRLIDTYNYDNATAKLTSIVSDDGITKNYEWSYNNGLLTGIYSTLGANQYKTQCDYNTVNGFVLKKDENNQITSYEYDEYGRLKLIRDNDNNILTRYTYHDRNIANGKVVGQITINEYKGESYLYTTGVTITNSPVFTFRVSAAEHGAFYIKPAIDVKDKNYVSTDHVMDLGITSESQIESLSNDQKSTSYLYSDGVGRPQQSVIYGGSPSGNDIVKPYAYDQYGRMIFNYKPYAASDQTGTFRESSIADQAAFYTNTPEVSSDSRPYQEVEYELSPLNRVKQAFGAGSLWKNATTSKSTKALDQINIAGTVRRWTINTSGFPTTSGFYGAGTLLYVTSIDEDGNTSKRYMDDKGNVVMNDNDGLITYYIYDELGRLRFILPPELVNDYPPATTSVTLDQTTLDTWVFQYKYDVRGRLSEEKGPGIHNDWVYYVYDQWNRIVLKQDGVQRNKSPKEWSFIKYDALNRPVITGIIKTINSADHTTLINNVSGGRYESRDASSLGYTITGSFPVTNSVITSIDVLTAIYYDDYSFLNNTGWSESNSSYNPDSGLPYLSTVKGLVTGSKIKVLESNAWLTAVDYYDKYYQKIQTIHKNHLTTVPDRITNSYNDTGWITQSKRVHANYNASGTTTIVEDYEYDHTGRLKKVYHQINTNPRVLLASYNYNEAGQLVEKNLHSTDDGNSFLQSVDYRYNIRGWLTSINNSSLTNDNGLKNDDANDLFGMELLYNEEAIGINSVNTQPKYNGSITAIRWKSNDLKTPPVERIYGYDYNTTNWILNGRYAAKNGSLWNSEAGFYNLEGLQYDDNGNIKSLQRYGKSGTSKVKIDDLTYVYGSDGNELTSVTDNAGSFSNFGYPNKTPGISPTMSYDKNGNLNSDISAEVTSVTYNYLNLPSSITIDLPGTSNDYLLEFTYDATGYLLKRTIKKGGVTIKTIDYVKGIQYYDSQLALIFTREGRASYYNGGFEYEYFLKDHLSNTRLVFGSLHETDVYKATMESELSAKEESDYGFKGMNTRFAANNHTKSSMDVPVPNESAKLNGFTGNTVGPAKVLQVHTGDKVKLEVYARTINATTSNSVVTNLASAVLSTFGIIDAGDGHVVYQAMSSALPACAGQIVRSSNSPKAYLFYIVFNNSYTSYQFGYASVDATSLLQHQKLQLDVTVPSDGFMYMYVANESNVSAVTDAYFDDFRIIHEKSTSSLQVTEMTDYDPFGFPLEGTRYVDESRLVNNYKYQGNYAEYDELTGWNRFVGRGNYDVRLGRWHSIDPKYQFSTPYMAMGNSYIGAVDPDGRIAWFWPVIAGAVGGGVAGGIIADRNGQDWWKGAIVGSLAGAGLGAGFSSILGTNAGITGLGSSAWNIVSNGLTWGNVSILSNLLQGRGLQGAWKAGVLGFASGAFGALVENKIQAMEKEGIGFATDNLGQGVSGAIYGFGDRFIRARERNYKFGHTLTTSLFGLVEGGFAGAYIGDQLGEEFSNNQFRLSLATSSVVSFPGLTLSALDGFALVGAKLVGPLAVGVTVWDAIDRTPLNYVAGLSSTFASYFILSTMYDAIKDEYENYYPETLTLGKIFGGFR